MTANPTLKETRKQMFAEFEQILPKLKKWVVELLYSQTPMVDERTPTISVKKQILLKLHK